MWVDVDRGYQHSLFGWMEAGDISTESRKVWEHGILALILGGRGPEDISTHNVGMETGDIISHNVERCK